MQISRKYRFMIVIMSVVVFLMGCNALSDYNTNKESVPYYERKLLEAVRNDRLELAKEAIKEGADLNQFKFTSYKKAGDKETNPLFVALDMGAFDTAEYLITNGANLNNYKNKDGETYLTFFSTRQYSQCKRFIPLLLKHGANPTLTDRDGYTPVEKMLIYSDMSDKYIKQFINLFEQNGYHVDKDTIKIAYYFYGCKMLPEMTKELIKEGKETGLSSFEENIILGNSNKVNKAISIELLKKYNEEDIINLVTAYCNSEALDKCNQLIKKDVNYNSLLIVASMAGNLENVKYLIGQGADINYVSKGKRTPLLWSVVNEHYDVAEYLLQSGSRLMLDRSSFAPEGVTNELCAASMNGNIKLLKLILKYINTLEDTDVSLALQTAANYDQDKIFNFFLDKGFTGEIIDSNNQSVLEELIYYRNNKMLNLLIEHGADVNGKDINSGDGIGDALGKAIDYGDTESVECLLKNGAKPLIRHLISAIYKANLEDIKLLIEYGTDVNGTTEEGNPVLFYAAAYSNNILRYLVEHGADVNQCEPSKDTPPLIIAVNNGMVDNAKYLIEAGADTSKRNATGKTAYEFAKESKYQPMIEMFEEMGVKE